MHTVAEKGRAEQGLAGQRRVGRGRAWQSRAEKVSAGQGLAGQKRVGQGRKG